MSGSRTSRLTQLTRGIRLVFKLIEGLFLVGGVFPQIRPHERDVIIVRWCREVLEVFSIQLNLHGETPPPRLNSVLFVANHVSWMDILVINACHRVRFVAKAEVRHWPLVGWLAARTGTLFFKRTSTRDLARVAKGVTASLRRGHCVALFPEGTTTDGTSIQTFHSGLFESAIQAGSPVWPIAIQYRQQNGQLDSDIAFVGDQSLVSSILKALARPPAQARLTFASPIASSAGDRRALTTWCQQTIQQSLAEHISFDVLSPSLPQVPAKVMLPPLTAA